MFWARWAAAAGAVLIVAACARQRGEAAQSDRRASLPRETWGVPDSVRALDGRILKPVPIEPARRAQLEEDLRNARRAYEFGGPTEDAIIWLGRRHAYLGHYRTAIAVFSEGIRRYPESYRLRRHRGHRYITVRELDKAVDDLARAAALAEKAEDTYEPDGAPNRYNIPRSTDKSNIWYHLGLALYLKGEFDQAANAWGRCMDFSRANDDMLVATANWWYAALRRAGRDEEAAAVLEEIRPEMEILENTAYHRLLLMYKGLLPADEVLGSGQGAVDDATTGYGVGNWYWVNGEYADAKRVWDRVLQGEQWAAFGYIAAEAELARGWMQE